MMRMPRLSAKTHIALGQTVLVVSVVFTALCLGAVPDERSAVRAGRVALTESIALSGSELIEAGGLPRLEALLRSLDERNADLLSAAVRREGSGALVEIGDHARHWDASLGDRSTDEQIRVPLFARGQRWGEVQLRFAQIAQPGWRGVAADPRVRATGILALVCFVGFYLYLRQALRYLDPSQAVPPHVRSALDTLAEGLIVVDLEEHIVLGNQAFAATVGRGPQALVGQIASRLDWVEPDGSPRPGGQFPWARAVAEGAPQTNDILHMRDREGRVRTFIVNCSPVFVSGGRCGGVLASFDDVTQLEESKTQLASAKEEAEAANRAKSAFLANMSHEIRTPLNAILGFTEVLKRGYGKGKSDPRKYLDTISSSGEHLLQLINDVLDLSKVESGRLDLEQVRFAPHSLIEEVIRVLSVKAREKSLRLEFSAQGPVPETILSDPTRLRQIVTNLLSNAIKFTPQGEVRVVARLQLGGREPCFCIDVIDSGIGVAADMTEKIFDPFVQADSSITRRFGGTGLGLPISRRFARLLGGDISVRSEPGGGSTFTATLHPGSLEGVRLLALEEALARPAESSGEHWEQWSFPPVRVLVVDDGEENRELIRVVLEEVGITVESADNGRAGVERAQQSRFDAILMDMQMPIMDGYTATRQLRSGGVRVPIVAVTGSAMKGSEHRCIEAGCTAYVLKPIKIDLLLQTLAQLLGGERRERPAAGQPAPGPRPAASAPLVSRLADKGPKFAAIVEKFTVRLEEKLAEMELCWNKRDFEALARLGHWLKGSAGTVGLDEFREPAAALEALAVDRKEIGIEDVLRELREMADRIEVAGGRPGSRTGAEAT